MATQLQLCRSKAPLYLRFSGIFALLCSLWGAGGQHCAWLGRGLVLAVLLRRLFRAWGGWPSRALRGPSGALAPTVDGLHRRFAELYLDGKAEEGEAAVLGAQQRVELNGQRVAFWDVGDGEGAVLVCNGLGARVMTWAPLLSALGASWAKRRLVIFDYPGQFDSQPLVGDISVERSAADAYRLAQHLKLQRVMLLCWSTGVQVGLQLALDHPELVEAMVLIQGTTGEAMSALLQPLCPMPGVPSLLRLGLRVAPAAMRRPRPLMEAALRRYRGFFEALGSCVLWFFGSDLIPAVGVRYVADMLQTEEHFANYCGYALALGRHKIFDRLPEIKAPALVVTGTPDFITPARCSYDLAHQLGGHATLVDDVSGSHYYIFEEPLKLAQEMSRFAETHCPRLCP